MAYAITEYEFWGNPKVREAGKDAVLMYLAGNSYCNQFMTDGLITFASIATVANLAFQRNPDKAIKALIDNRLWLKDRKGYQVNDYLKYNKSKAQIEDLMSKRSSAGKASARSRVSIDELTPEPTSVETPVEQVLNIEHLLPSISYSNSNYNDSKDKNKLNDSLWLSFSAAFQELTNIEPKPTKPVVDMLAKFQAAGVTTDEYRKAISEMLAGGYSCPSMKSPETWVMNNRNGSKKKPKVDETKGSYEYFKQLRKGSQ